MDDQRRKDEAYAARLLRQRDSAWNHGDALARAVSKYLEDGDREAMRKALSKYSESNIHVDVPR